MEKKVEDDLDFLTRNVQTTEEDTKNNVNFVSGVLLVLPMITSVILWITFSVKAFLLFIALYSFGMFTHITITTWSNAFIGREVNVQGDIFWKMFFLFIGCLTLTIFFSI